MKNNTSIDISAIPELLSCGKMVFHYEPYFVLELDIEASELTDNKIEMLYYEGEAMGISPDNCKYKIHLCKPEEDYEFRVYIYLHGRKYEYMYDVFAEGLYKCLTGFESIMQSDLKDINLKTDPRTAGLFGRTTFNRIMHGEWAMANVEFVCEAKEARD